jgi:chromosome partitioning protein
MAFLLCVANQKGGTGKTTTAMNLAGGLSVAKYPVLVLDADPQASALAWANARGPDTLPFQVCAAGDVLRGDARAELLRLARSKDYEIIIIDCPPGAVDGQDIAGRVARAAIAESDAVLVPMRPSTLDFSSTLAFAEYLASACSPGQRILALLNGCQPRTLLAREAPVQAAKIFAAMPGAWLLGSTIGMRTLIAEVSGSGKTIFEYAPQSEAAREYTTLTKEVIACLAKPLSLVSPAQLASLPVTAPSSLALS